VREQRDLFRRIVLQVIQHCLECRRPFEETDISIVGQTGETWLFSLHCRHCNTLAVVGLALKPGDESTLGEEVHLDDTSPLTTDDLLDMCLFLEDFDGDFQRLFRDLKPTGPSEEPLQQP
jgi:hypothetical protein